MFFCCFLLDFTSVQTFSTELKPSVLLVRLASRHHFIFICFHSVAFVCEKQAVSYFFRNKENSSVFFVHICPRISWKVTCDGDNDRELIS